MKVIVLVENVSEGVLGCAHGLSLYAETEKHRILFDAGPDGDLLMRNAAALGVDLSGVDIAVLSHGHYDHARGMAAFLELNTAAKLYLHRLTLRGHFAHEKDGWRNIGLDPELVERFSGRFVLTGDGCVIDEELQLFADIKTRDLFSSSNATLFEEGDAGRERDSFRHEQNLLIRSGGQTVLLAGCAHAGIVNILRRAEELLGRSPDWALAGFHLTNPGLKTDELSDFVRAVGSELKKRGTVYITGHCTGLGPYGVLKDLLGEQIRYMSAGTVFEL